jgi:cation:H+ antiporter
MDVFTFVFFVIGIGALVVGAEALVKGAARLAARTGLSPIVIGLTVVAFGTSAPELAVSMGAAIRDEADLAIGNVVGSNIANVLLVLGISAAVGGGLVVAQRIVRIDVPIMVALSVLVFVLGLDNELGRIEGIVFVLILISYITWTVRASRRHPELIADDDYDEYDADHLADSSPWREFGYLVAGLVLLVIGSTSLVEAATDIAEALGVSELVIGLTVVAIGTSLPEVATSVVAAARGQRDLAVGNAVGSNMFNILAVLGLTATFSPSALPIPDSALRLDLPVMIAVAIACLPIFAYDFSLRRWEGVLFLAYYGAYLAWLALDASDSSLADPFAVAVVGFMLPLGVLTIAIIAWRNWRAAPVPLDQTMGVGGEP